MNIIIEISDSKIALVWVERKEECPWNLRVSMQQTEKPATSSKECYFCTQKQRIKWLGRCISKGRSNEGKDLGLCGTKSGTVKINIRLRKQWESGLGKL